MRNTVDPNLTQSFNSYYYHYYDQNTVVQWKTFRYILSPCYQISTTFQTTFFHGQKYFCKFQDNIKQIIFEVKLTKICYTPLGIHWLVLCHLHYMRNMFDKLRATHLIDFITGNLFSGFLK